MKGVLYLIPVPISDEEENSGLVYPLLESTVNTLSEFIVEDLKTTRRSLRKIFFTGEFDKMTFHVLNKHTDTKSIGSFLASADKGKNIGLLSEAGMPCIADPGSDIVRLAHSKNIRVVPLYGQSSIFLALAASGLNGQNFIFHGYLPKEQKERRKKLKELSPSLPSQRGGTTTSPSSLQEGFRTGLGCTHIFIETPYRNNHLLSDILSTCSPETLLCVAMNVTGKSEMILTKSIAEWRKVVLPSLDKQPTVFLLGR
ncbi:MAG: SAM-dependent methyltransferase [Bacteroidetes bacterium]|nr:MAG: SAM-dependent methyltransferase [Bacteroidota bacterium]